MNESDADNYINQLAHVSRTSPDDTLRKTVHAAVVALEHALAIVKHDAEAHRTIRSFANRYV